MGRVVTQAVRMVRIVLARAVPLIRPMPKSAPTATCVVETGNPRRLAPATSREVWFTGETAVRFTTL